MGALRRPSFVWSALMWLFGFFVASVFVWWYAWGKMGHWKERALLAEHALRLGHAHGGGNPKTDGLIPLGHDATRPGPFFEPYEPVCAAPRLPVAGGGPPPGAGVACQLPRRSLTVVIPFPAKQMDMVQQNVASWSQLFFPCAGPYLDADDPGRPQVDLVFYLSRANATTRAAVHRLLDGAPARRWRERCFRHVYLRSAGLSAADDQYGPGTVQLFYNLFAFVPDAPEPAAGVNGSQPVTAVAPGWSLADGVADRRDEPVLARRTDFVLWMEPDLRPVRPHWLSKLVDEVTTAPDFWMRGSLPRYPVHASFTYNFHLNGNALYNFWDERFANYVLQSRGAFDEYVSFDLSLMAARVDNYKLAQQYGHKFQATDTIQNRGYQDLTLPTFRQRHPLTFLVHGRSMVNAIQRYTDELRQ